MAQAVKEALQIPVLANGNIRDIHDVDECLAKTGADGVMSADSLLEDPALFWAQRRSANSLGHLEGCRLMLEYLDLWEQYPVPTRMVRGHAFKMLGETTLLFTPQIRPFLTLWYEGFLLMLRLCLLAAEASFLRTEGIFCCCLENL